MTPLLQLTGEVFCFDQEVLVDRLEPYYTMEIAVIDPNGLYTVGPQNLTIHLINRNSPPLFINVPGIARVPEDQNGGSIYKVYNILPMLIKLSSVTVLMHLCNIYILLISPLFITCCL